MPHSAPNQLPRVPLAILAFCWLCMFGSFLLPQIPVEGQPAGAIPLDGELASAAVYVAKSGRLWGIATAVIVVAILLASRAGISWKRRLVEFSILMVVMAALLAGGSWLNEEVLKPILGVHRPNIVLMDEDRTLGMSVEAFFGMPANLERSDWLKQILENKYFEGVKLSAPVRKLWISEGGLSLPSGPTIGTFLLLTFALISTWTIAPGWRFALACLLVPWTLAVGFSDILLLTHWPNDLIVSGMAGILLGIGVFKLLQRLLWSNAPEVETNTVNPSP